MAAKGGINKHRHREEHGRPGINQLVPNLFSAIGGINRRDRSTGDGDSVKDDRVLRQVGCHQPDNLAGRDTARCEPTGKRMDGVAEMVVR